MAGRASSVQLAKAFRDPVASVRPLFEARAPELALFDFLCAAGDLGFRLPDEDVNVRFAVGARDPRVRLRRLARTLSAKAGPRHSWAAMGRRLARRLARLLAKRDGGDLHPLHVLLAYAPAALAPDCRVPSDPFLRVAWTTAVGVFAERFTTTVRRLGRLPSLDRPMLARLRREAAPGLRIGRTASGRRPGAAGRSLAVAPALLQRIGKALGRRVAPGYVAKYLYYVRAGDHVWPHPDDPKYTANCLICVDRVVPAGQATGSAFLAFRADGSVERYELEPGHALVMDSGVVHAREPLGPGERVVLLSILCS